MFQFKKLDAVHTEESFLIMTDIRSESPWPIQLKSSNIELVRLMMTDIHSESPWSIQLNW